MKSENYYLIMAVVLGIFCIAAPEAIEANEPNTPEPISITNPVLAGIDGLSIVIIPSYVELERTETFWRELYAKINRKIIKADIKVISENNFGASSRIRQIPYLRVNIDQLNFGDSQQYVFRIQTSLDVTLTSRDDPFLIINVDVWSTVATVGVTSVQNIPAVLTNLVLKQTDAFVAALLAANPQIGRTAGATPVGVRPAAAAKKRNGSAVKPEVAKYKYIASKRGRVFHKPDGASAKRIKPGNLVGYESRDEAIKAGKRPCKRCNP